MASLAINARAARIGHGQGVHVKCLPQPLRHGVLGVNFAVAAKLLATKVLARCIIICNLYAGWNLGLGTASRATATELPARAGQGSNAFFFAALMCLCEWAWRGRASCSCLSASCVHVERARVLKRAQTRAFFVLANLAITRLISSQYHALHIVQLI